MVTITAPSAGAAGVCAEQKGGTESAGGGVVKGAFLSSQVLYCSDKAHW